MALLKRSVRLPLDKEYFMSWFSGSESGLATTTAIIAGLMASRTPLEVIALTAVISFTIQAFNGAINSFSTSRTDDEIESVDNLRGYRKPVLNALLHFVSHVLMSALVLLPILVVADAARATILSITITLSILFMMGLLKARLAKTHMVRDGLEMVLLGALIIGVGGAAGIILTG